MSHTRTQPEEIDYALMTMESDDMEADWRIPAGMPLNANVRYAERGEFDNLSASLCRQ